MPQNRNQHYVPRAHFKPFSVEEHGDAIHLYNIRSDRTIENAPLRGQCAKHYFYGRDLVVEKFLEKIEGQYATIVRKLNIDADSLDDADFVNLRRFTFLQALRTEAATRRVSVHMLKMKTAVFRELRAERPDMTDNEIVLQSMRIFLDSREQVADLKSCILINRTHRGFVTSDDPAILTNRYHFQRLRTPTFGWGNSGALMFLPLTPEHALMCYDGLVYTVPEKRGSTVEVVRSSDVDAINEFQALNCSRNLYFADWNDRGRTRDDYRAVADRRVDSRHTLHVLIKTHSDDRGDYYRLATEEEQNGNGPFIVNTSSVFPQPRRWPSCLLFRHPPRTFSNGSAMGYVRKAEWLETAR